MSSFCCSSSQTCLQMQKRQFGCFPTTALLHFSAVCAKRVTNGHAGDTWLRLGRNEISRKTAELVQQQRGRSGSVAAGISGFRLFLFHKIMKNNTGQMSLFDLYPDGRAAAAAFQYLPTYLRRVSSVAAQPSSRRASILRWRWKTNLANLGLTRAVVTPAAQRDSTWF